MHQLYGENIFSLTPGMDGNYHQGCIFVHCDLLILSTSIQWEWEHRAFLKFDSCYSRLRLQFLTGSELDRFEGSKLVLVKLVMLIYVKLGKAL